MALQNSPSAARTATKSAAAPALILTDGQIAVSPQHRRLALTLGHRTVTVTYPMPYITNFFGTLHHADRQRSHAVQRLRDERGAVGVVVALLMVPLIGFAAIAIDVSAMYAERQQLQTGADAGALAIAQDCAPGACGSPGADRTDFAADQPEHGHVDRHRHLADGSSR